MSDPLEDIYNIYKSKIYNYFYRSTFNRHTAEELTHDTFLRAFNSINNFQGRSSIKTWLFTIARNTYINHIRKKSTQFETQFDPVENQFADQTDNYSALEDKILIRKILFQLPEKSRTLIILRDQYGFSYSEISNIIGETEGQIKIGLYRARKKFKELYQEQNHPDG